MDASDDIDLEQWSKEKVFKCKEELLSWAWDVESKNGFVIVIKTSDYGGSHRTPRIYLACERSGQYRAHKKLKGDGSNNKIVKIMGTKKCWCPFELKARKLMADDDWMIDIACGMHNHALAKHFEGHSFVERLSEEETSLLVDMSKSMVRPKKILVTLKTIYNVCHRNNVIEKARRSQMKQLLGELEKHNHIERHKCDNNMMTVTDFLLDDIPILEVIVTDRELALMNAIDSHVDSKALFEKSLIIVQHQFKPSHFRELRGNIFITALDHGRPIPFDSINPHWRTLELVQKLKNDEVELSCKPKFDLMLKRFNASDYTM
ncbi:hypothetical protein CsSME_00045827 [Camellia sinensis var. sinensis]